MPFFSASVNSGFEIAIGVLQSDAADVHILLPSPELSELALLWFPHGLHKQLDTLFYLKF